MPFNREFLDARAKVGYPTRAPLASTRIKADSSSRSLSKASVDHGLDRSIRLEIKLNYLHLDTSQIINSGKIRINKTNAVKLARWIIEKFNADTKETNVVGARAKHERVSSKPIKAASKVED